MTMWQHWAQQNYAGSCLLESTLRDWSLGNDPAAGSSSATIVTSRRILETTDSTSNRNSCQRTGPELVEGTLAKGYAVNAFKSPCWRR